MRRVAVLLLVLLAAGCGGGGGGDDLEGPSAQKVADGFAKASGTRLVTSSETPDWTLLRFPDGRDAYEQYGVFSLYVVKTKRGRDILLQDPETRKPIEPEGGIYYKRGTGSLQASKRYGGNVVLAWTGGGEDQTVTDDFKRLDTTVQAAVTGRSDLVPAAERPCGQVGIDPNAATGKEGSCRLEGVRVSVVGAGGELRTPVLNARLKAARVSRSIPPPTRFGRTERARGRFVVVSYSLENTGDEPIEFLESKLVVGGRTYSADSGVAYNLQGNRDRPLPAQPGESVTLREAFDVPPDVAEQALAEGLLALPAERSAGGGSLSDRGAQGRIRLAGAGAEGDPTLDREDPAAKARAREKGAEAAVREVFSIIRSRDVSGLCKRLTEGARASLGGGAGCQTGRVVSDKAVQQVPSSSRGLKLDTILTRKDTRALINARAKGYRGIVTLARQGEYWRVRSLARTGP